MRLLESSCWRWGADMANPLRMTRLMTKRRPNLAKSLSWSLKIGASCAVLAGRSQRAQATRGFTLGCLGALALMGCASSSSQTPWPVAPDFERLRADAAEQRGAGTEWSATDDAEAEEIEDLDAEEREAPSTWGGGRAPASPASRAPAGAKPDLADTEDLDDDSFFNEETDED